jgi:hypothetical protein
MRMHQTPVLERSLVVAASIAAFSLAAAVWMAGCDSAANGGCTTDADCPGGVCVALAASRECRPVAGGDDLSTAGPGDGGIGGGPSDAAFGLDAVAALCQFNGDGVIDRSEEPFLVGLGTLFAVNPAGTTVSVNLKPVGGVWDFTAMVPNERKTFDQLLSPGGTWWAADFPNATYAEILDDGQSLYGVYQVTSDSLLLLGVVSEQEGLQKTELTYSTPIQMLKFPLKQGDSWTSESNASGLASGVVAVTHDQYTFTVDARGTAKVPAGTFDTLRLRANYTQTYGFLVTTRIIYLHLAECYGSVARIRSQDNEQSNDFTQATEYRRLATQ